MLNRPHHFRRGVPRKDGRMLTSSPKLCGRTGRRPPRL